MAHCDFSKQEKIGYILIGKDRKYSFVFLLNILFTQVLNHGCYIITPS